jgi:hypothetical protein
MARAPFDALRHWLRALTATARRRRLLLIASLAPGVVIADVAVSVWRDPVMFAVGLVLVAGAILAQLRPKPLVVGRAARTSEPLSHQETRP